MLYLLVIGCNGDDPEPSEPSRPETLDDAAAQIHGQDSEVLGLAVAAVGDVDGDGTADLAAAGLAARVCVFSAASIGSVDVSRCVGGESGADTFGAAIDGGGDLDGTDGVEWAVGAPTAGGGVDGPGAVYVFSGVPGSTAEAWVTIRGGAPLDAFGTAVRMFDADDDGATDLIVGATGTDGALVPDAGAAHVFFGPLTPGEHSATDSELQLEGGLPLRHVGAPGNALGGSVGTVDADGDGVLDLLLSQGGTDLGLSRPNAGVAYLFLGPLVRGTVSAPGFADAVFEGTRSEEYSSEPIDGAGDLTGDGLDDVIVAANGTTPERVAVFSGVSTGVHLLDEADLTIDAVTPGESTGWALGTGADVDGDGAVDLLVGSPYGGAGNQGEVRVLLAPVGTGTLVLGDQPAVVGPEPGSEFGKALALPGDVDGDGRDDFAIGVPRANYVSGTVALYGGF